MAGTASRAQIMAGFGPTTYYFLSSKDNNLHYGANLRLSYDTHQILFDAGFSIYDKVISTVRTLGHLSTLKPGDPGYDFFTVPIYNSVTGQSWQLFLNCQYFFKGIPEEKSGFYGILGVTALNYSQTNKLSTYDQNYFPSPKFIDNAVHISTEILVNAGFGAKYSLRHSSLFVEGIISIPTDNYLDYQYPIENSMFFSINAGVRFTLRTHRNVYQRWDINLNPF
ncbi:MAG: hypothetical protein NTW49_05295 [Bacteroidia bacterium]|nr:hypothetical protein [Bacteroidia bacterium]